MPRRLASVLGVAALFLIGSASVATAATYPPTDNQVTIVGGASDISVGDEVDFDAKTFKSSSDVTFSIAASSGAMGSLRGAALVVPVAASGTCESSSTCVRVADSDGVATAAITFTEAGKQTVTATGVDPDGNDLTVTATVTVAGAAAPAGSSPGGLATTGTNLIRYGVIGLALVAVGTLLVLAVRRRSGPTAV